LVSLQATQNKTAIADQPDITCFVMEKKQITHVIGSDGVGWIDMAQDMDQWRALRVP
jgi:hypothetical protein